MTTETANGHGVLPPAPTRPPTQAEIDQAQAVLAAQQQAAAEAAQQLQASARREIPLADLSHLAPAGQAPIAPQVVQPAAVPVGTPAQTVPVQQVAQPVQDTPAGQALVPAMQAPPTLNDWFNARRARGKQKSAWQRRFQRGGAVLACVAVGGMVGTWYMARVADNRLGEVYAYIDGPVAEQLGGAISDKVSTEVAAQLQQAPKQLVSSDPLEKMLPCLLSGDAKRMIGADPTLGSTTLNQEVTQALAQQYRTLSMQVLPQQVRIYTTSAGAVALSVDPAVGAALLDPATCGTGG